MVKKLINTIKNNKPACLLFLLAFVLYANTIGHDYAWDDSIVITENVRVKKGIVGIADLFLKYNSDYKSDKYGYRPIVLSSFAIEYGLFKNKPGVSHFMNVFYFSLLCFILFNVLIRLFNGWGNLVAFMTTVVFITHPVHTEAVANIKSRDEIFALLFSLLTLRSFLNYFDSKEKKHLLWLMLYFLLAYLSKESAIMFLAILPLVIVFRNGRTQLKKMLIPAAVITVLGVLSFMIYWLYTGSTLGKNSSLGAGIYYESGLLGNSFFYTDMLSGKIVNAFAILWIYFTNFIWPVKQLYYYGYNQIPVATLSQPSVIASIILHSGLLIFIVFGYKKHRWISFGLLFYLITIFVYLHLMRTLADTMADRFLFTPSIGLCMAMVFLILAVFKIDANQSIEGFINNKKSQSSKYNSGARIVFLSIALLLSIKTFTRNKVWKNNWTLISTDMRDLENCARAHLYYANELKRKQNKIYSQETESEIISHYRRAIEISDESYYAYIGLAVFYAEKKQHYESINVLQLAIKKYNEQADLYYYLGDAYYNLNQTQEAIIQLEKSLKLAPNVPSTYESLINAYIRNKEFTKALAVHENYRKHFPEGVKLYETLSLIYFEMGDLDNSAKNLLETIRFGADAQLVYKVVIGRYQSNKQDSIAALYYRQGLQRGIFR